MPRWIVIGAGVIGLAVARELALAGADVTVLEARRPGAGTSGASFAWVNSNQKRPESYRRLNWLGMQEYSRLAGDGAEWWRPRGHLRWALPGAEADRLAEVRAEVVRDDYPVVVLTRRQAVALEPDLVLPDAVEDVTFFPTEGHCFPVPMMAELAADLRAHGGRLRYPCTVSEVRVDGAGVSLTLRDGERMHADGAISCVGRWTEELLSTAGLSVPLQPYTGPGSAPVGFLGVTTPVAATLDRLLTTPRINVRPHGGGRLLLQAPALDEQADPHAPPELDGPIAAALLRELADALRDTAGARLESLVVGWRVLPLDRLTVAGFADDGRRLYAIATHSGVTLAPLLARLARQEILTGRDAPELADFRPSRFARDAAGSAAAEPVRTPGYQ